MMFSTVDFEQSIIVAIWRLVGEQACSINAFIAFKSTPLDAVFRLPLCPS